MKDDNLIIRFEKVSNLDKKDQKEMNSFSCGIPEIDCYLHEDSYNDTCYGVAKTWLLFANNNLIGYFTLTADKMKVIRTSNIRLKLQETHDTTNVSMKSIPSIQIHHFAVHTKYQNKGYGRIMMEHVLVFIKELILSNLGACLITVQSLKSAVGFYEKMGFEKTGDSRDQMHPAMAFHTNDLFKKQHSLPSN